MNLKKTYTYFSIQLIFASSDFTMASERKRSQNFSQSEINIFLELVDEQRVKVIEDKRTDGKIIKEKQKCWQEIADEFNASSGLNKRDIMALKYLWKRLKQDTKKKHAEESREIRKTGGGQNLSKPLSPKSERIRNLLPQEQISPTLISTFDSDACPQYSGSFLHQLENDSSINEDDFQDTLTSRVVSTSTPQPPIMQKKTTPRHSISQFQQELLRMATIEHNQKMKVQRLKEKYYHEKLQRL